MPVIIICPECGTQINLPPQDSKSILAKLPTGHRLSPDAVRRLDGPQLSKSELEMLRCIRIFVGGEGNVSNRIVKEMLDIVDRLTAPTDNQTFAAITGSSNPEAHDYAAGLRDAKINSGVE